jgi:hypothetical protein
VPTELMSVTETARDFLTKSGYVFFRLQKAEFDAAKNQWNLVYDVGVSVEKIKRVVIDGATGKVVAFE